MNTSPDPTQAAQPQPPASPSTDDADALLEALARLRGRRRRRGPHGLRGPGNEHFGRGRSGQGWGPHEGWGGRGGDQGQGGHGGHGGHGGQPLHDGRGEPGGHDWPGGRGGRGSVGGPALMRMLGVLAHSPEPLSVSELAEHIGVDQPRASRLVQQAVALGHAEREADPADARRTRVRLTESGEQLVHGVRNQQRDEASTALEALDANERSELLRLIGKLAEAWPTGS